ncbi:MAG: preprotein translocase subunit YajC [Pirellulales bacterium]|jgi:preprotein translocase subunit YajC|nr:preprotein translocase subunit YajC [Pirellulales bacterium]
MLPVESFASFLLAQEAAAPEAGGGLMRLALPVLVIGFMFYFMLIRPERQKQGRHRQLLENLKKNDRVLTAGGIKGVVSSVNRDQQEVTLTVDESTGTKIRVNISSIAGGEEDLDSGQGGKK